MVTIHRSQDYVRFSINKSMKVLSRSAYHLAYMAMGQNPGTLVNIPKTFKIVYNRVAFPSPKR